MRSRAVAVPARPVRLGARAAQLPGEPVGKANRLIVYMLDAAGDVGKHSGGKAATAAQMIADIDSRSAEAKPGDKLKEAPKAIGSP